MKYFVLCFFFCGSLFAQEIESPRFLGSGINDPVMALLYVAITRLTPVPKRSIPQDQIWGKCSYGYYTCNGAEIILLDKDGIIRDTRRIAGDPRFTFSGIEKSTEYKIRVRYQKIVSKQFSVSAGEEVLVALNENEI